MFTAACRGKDGNRWIIHIPVERREDAQNIIEQLGLDVDDEHWGELVAEGPLHELDSETLISMTTPQDLDPGSGRVH